LVTKEDSEIIEAILHLDPKDVSMEIGKNGPYNLIEVFQEKARQVAQ
jgi:hypothetical protein